ncbi:YwqH-like family protein [Peribacillus sp. B-H-3]|uniref:YwqH-like family protein n=1 Tax=Peribacillus sp. B-H-3 TaxID=3400420 RepID=UPI003B020694
MEVTDSLKAAHDAASSAIANFDEQIARLKAAKADINKEKDTGLTEIKAILEPDLGKSWTGKRSESFEKARKKAHTTISNILNDDYDQYISEIESKITWLELERNALAIASAAVATAEKASEKGEKIYEEVGHYLNDLRKKVF